jgi:urease accessory protein
MPMALSASTFWLGFIVATGLLHASGVAIGLPLSRRERGRTRRAFAIAGGAIAAIGAGLLAGLG